jgi:hypothetical protein
VAKKRVGKYPLSFKQMAMERMKDCASVSALADDRYPSHRAVSLGAAAKGRGGRFQRQGGHVSS